MKRKWVYKQQTQECIQKKERKEGMECHGEIKIMLAYLC